MFGGLIALVIVGLIIVVPIFVLIRISNLQDEADKLGKKLKALDKEVWQLRRDLERVEKREMKQPRDEAAGELTEQPKPEIEPTPEFPVTPLPDKLLERKVALPLESAEAKSKFAESAAPPPIPPPLPPPLPVFSEAPATASDAKPRNALEEMAAILPESGKLPPIPRRIPEPPAPGGEEELPDTFEARVGKVWALRIGLVLLTIAVAYFARLIAMHLTPWMKTALAYLGAIGLYAVGKVFEEKLRAFARPVMAGALAIGFFVSYAAHFINPMHCIGWEASSAWMLVGVGLIFFHAEKWKSQYTAGLAVFLGHVAAFVSARDAGSFSLVVIAFLSLASVAMFLRNDWPPLSLFGAVAAYASHLLWMTFDPHRGPSSEAFWTSFIFLSSYYIIFMSSDLFWWGRLKAKGEEALSLAQQVSSRAVAPLNLVAYVSLVSFLWVAQRPAVGEIYWFFFGLAAAQAALGWAHRRAGNQDWVFYPALAVIFATVGLVDALDGVTLNIVLAAEALILLLAAHRTRLWIFHFLAQAALALNFIHYWGFQAAHQRNEVMTTGAFIGGMMVVLVYFVKSQLEEIWYGGEARIEWQGAGQSGVISRKFAQAFDALYSPLAPYLAHLHAAAGAILLTHQTDLYFDRANASLVLSGALLAIIAFALVRRSVPMLWGYLILQFGLSVYVSPDLTRIHAPDSPWIQLGVVASSWIASIGLIMGAPARLIGSAKVKTALILSQITLWIGVASAVIFLGRLRLAHLEDPYYFAWIGAAALLYVSHDRFKSALEWFKEGILEERQIYSFFSAIACVASSLLITMATWSSFASTSREAVPVWLSVWMTVAIAASGWRRNIGFYLGGFLLLLVSHFTYYWADSREINPYVPIWLSLLTLALAGTKDMLLRDRQKTLPAEALNLAELFILATYTLGLGVFSRMIHHKVGVPWQFPLAGAAALALYEVCSQARIRRGGLSASIYLLIVHFWYFLTQVDLTSYRPDHSDPFLPILLLFGVGIIFGWRLTRGPGIGYHLGGEKAEPILKSILIPITTITVMTAIYYSQSFGENHQLTTAGWGGLGLLLIGLGFGFGSAIHRRTALAVLTICLARVFLVDTQGLETEYKMFAFLILGVCLLGVAWLYNRFSAQFKKWL
ncbi:DUF2339 domain-containing protein [Candidatus Sumerlaeota bacterium]|nr:DUF2339 domain-containing protein [Candidatus Sumerlaeota bacterium]